MNPITFNYTSSRARKARLSIVFDSIWLRRIGIFLALVSLIGWGFLALFEQLAIAHLLLIFVAVFLVPIAWYEGELKNLPAAKSITSIDDALDRKILGRLPASPTIQDIARISTKDTGGRFFAARFAISSELLTQLTSAVPEDAQKVWQYAMELTGQTDQTLINSATVVAAIIFTLPDYNLYLAQLNLDGDDITAGVKWYAHIQVVVRNFQQKGSHGGLGRDLSFGWAPLLNRIGQNITESIESGGLLHRAIGGHEEIISQIIHLLTQPGRRNAVLVGEVGVGKTTLVYALAQKMLGDKAVPRGIKYQQIISLDASSLIAQAKGRGDLEELLIRLLNEAASSKNVILFLDEAQLFLQDKTGSVDLSNILLPVLEGGGIRLILAMSDQQWLALSQTNPGLSQLMNRVVVNPLDQADTMSVVEDQILLLEAQHKVTYMYQSLQEAYKLAERFIRDQAFPGKAIRLLEAAAGFPEQKVFITEKSVQEAVEKSFDVKVQTASTTEERDMLMNLEGKIHERMINQTHAVQVVSDALRRARAGVRNQSKPIGTFLFLGPTGVGKTELSKALAAVYFGGEDHLIRVDLNEYSQATDVTRLLEIGSQNTNSLTAQIAKQPFSVVLLDEIEKAHPNVLNVLLQMLDEGMLRDSDNKPVSFRDAIIIATSNAGADKIRAHIDSGEALEQFEESFVNELIDANIFRPEFLNRFDEIVLFRPLSKQELMQVVDLILIGINKTLASQKVSVQLTDSAKQILVDVGYDPRLGARPLRRVTQRSVENVVAQKLLTNSAAAGSTLLLDAPELQAALDKRS